MIKRRVGSFAALAIAAITLTGCSGGNGGLNIPTNQFVFFNNTSNALPNQLQNTVNLATSGVIGDEHTLSGFFSQTISPTLQRDVFIGLAKRSPIRVGDIFTLVSSPPPAPGVINGVVTYAEGIPPTSPNARTEKFWISVSGTVTVTAINDNSCTLQVSEAKMQPGDGLQNPNQATGTFTLKGTVTATGNLTRR